MEERPITPTPREIMEDVEACKISDPAFDLKEILGITSFKNSEDHGKKPQERAGLVRDKTNKDHEKSSTRDSDPNSPIGMDEKYRVLEKMLIASEKIDAAVEEMGEVLERCDKLSQKLTSAKNSIDETYGLSAEKSN